MAWLFDFIKSMQETRKLRKECLDELILRLNETGVDFGQQKIFWKQPDKRKCSTIMKEIAENIADMKRRNIPYSIQFFMENAPVPEGDFSKSVGIAKNPDYTKYIKQMVSIKKELEEKASQSGKIPTCLHRSYEEKKFEWESITIEEWEKKNIENGEKCPCCSNSIGNKSGFCNFCNGSGKINASQLRTYNMPIKNSGAFLYKNSRNSCKDEIESEFEKEIKQVGLDKKPLKYLKVYVKISVK